MSTTLRAGMPWRRMLCADCRRSLSTSPALASGHNRWSKIRHQKGTADAKKNALRTGFCKNLTLYSQLYGPDPNLNPQLAAVIANAKKNAVPKSTIEAAIARGQGRSLDGKSLESFTFEIMLQPNIALIVDVESESRVHFTQEINPILRRKSATNTPTKFLFTRRGRVVLSNTDPDSDAYSSPSNKPPVTVDDILEDAIEAGAEDVEADEEDGESEGNIVVWTAPNLTGPIVQNVAPKHGLTVVSAETIWDPNEDTQTPLSGKPDEMQRLADVVAALRGIADVKAVYTNADQGDAPDETWHPIAAELDW